MVRAAGYKVGDRPDARSFVRSRVHEQRARTLATCDAASASLRDLTQLWIAPIWLEQITMNSASLLRKQKMLPLDSRSFRSH